jgi:hypothetical protein
MAGNDRQTQDLGLRYYTMSEVWGTGQGCRPMKPQGGRLGDVVGWLCSLVEKWIFTPDRHRVGLGCGESALVNERIGIRRK